MSNRTALYVQRRELIDQLLRREDATEDDYTEAFKRITTGDLSATPGAALPGWLKEVGWWLLLGEPQAGLTLEEAEKAGRFVGHPRGSREGRAVRRYHSQAGRGRLGSSGRLAAWMNTTVRPRHQPGGHSCVAASLHSTLVPGDREWSRETAYDWRGGWGGAIEECTEYDDGQFWVDNGEYSSPVNYCPFCGEKAPTETWRRADDQHLPEAEDTQIGDTRWEDVRDTVGGAEDTNT